MYVNMLIIILFIICIILYISTNPSKLNDYEKRAKKRHYLESRGYFYDWAPNLKDTGTSFRDDVSLTPSPSPSPTPTPSPSPTPPIKTPLPTPKPSDIPVIKDCDAFIKAIGGYDGVVGCRNVLHAKCRDNKPNYKPMNAAEQKCVDYLAKFTGNICNCMASIHKVCMQSGRKH